MAIEDQIPTLVVLVSTLLGIGWWGVRDNREKMSRVEKELCQLREFINRSFTDTAAKWEKHEINDRAQFIEIFRILAKMEGRDTEREKRSPV